MRIAGTHTHRRMHEGAVQDVGVRISRERLYQASRSIQSPYDKNNEYIMPYTQAGPVWEV